MKFDLKQCKVEVFQIEERVHLIGNEDVNITYKEARIFEGANSIGDLKGYIDIAYPFAGLDLKLTLEIYTAINEDGYLDGVFKVPFANNKTCLNHLYWLQHMAEEHEEEMVINYEKCSCGGDMMPMYDEFPNWITFCSNCDSRNENYDYSPLPY